MFSELFDSYHYDIIKKKYVDNVLSKSINLNFNQYTKSFIKDIFFNSETVNALCSQLSKIFLTNKEFEIKKKFASRERMLDYMYNHNNTKNLFDKWLINQSKIFSGKLDFDLKKFKILDVIKPGNKVVKYNHGPLERVALCFNGIKEPSENEKSWVSMPRFHQSTIHQKNRYIYSGNLFFLFQLIKTIPKNSNLYFGFNHIAGEYNTVDNKLEKINLKKENKVAQRSEIGLSFIRPEISRNLKIFDPSELKKLATSNILNQKFFSSDFGKIVLIGPNHFKGYVLNNKEDIEYIPISDFFTAETSLGGALYLLFELYKLKLKHNRLTILIQAGGFGPFFGMLLDRIDDFKDDSYFELGRILDLASERFLNIRPAFNLSKFNINDFFLKESYISKCSCVACAK